MADQGWGEQGEELSSDTSAASQSTETSSDEEDDSMAPPSVSNFAECAPSIHSVATACEVPDGARS